MSLTVRMLGTRGVPARHGGFETAVENIGSELVRRGWRVIVYCQDSETPGGPDGPAVPPGDTYRGMELVRIPEKVSGPLGTVVFDHMAISHVIEHASAADDVALVFGYNTAVLNLRLRARGIPVVVNMDGIEWQRAKWNALERRFLRLNERLACRVGGDALIADHPEIHTHLAAITGAAGAAKLTTIAYGATAVHAADASLVTDLGLDPHGYVSVVARPVPENSILEMVQAFSRRPRGVKMAVLGDYSTGDYPQQVRAAASDEVVFVGPVYDADKLAALRLYSRAYLHGHTVGGTNPSLVEAMAAGNAVIAHDNRFNRWVADSSALYFADRDGFEQALERLLDSPALSDTLSRRARERHAAEFGWETITDRYESLLLGFVSARSGLPGRPSGTPSSTALTSTTLTTTTMTSPVSRAS